MTSEDQQLVGEWMDPLRPVQHTVRGETTKDKPGALPPSVYSRTQRQPDVIFFDSEQQYGHPMN